MGWGAGTKTPDSECLGVRERQSERVGRVAQILLLETL